MTPPMTPPMFDVEVHLEDRPGDLAALGECLGAASLSLEGGGVFTHGGVGVAHFLLADGPAAQAALTAAGLHVQAVRQVVFTQLDQGTPGQLGTLSRALADAGVNLLVQYSDHDHNLVLVVDDDDRGEAERAIEQWGSRRPPSSP